MLVSLKYSPKQNFISFLIGLDNNTKPIRGTMLFFRDIENHFSLKIFLDMTITIALHLM